MAADYFFIIGAPTPLHPREVFRNSSGEAILFYLIWYKIAPKAGKVIQNDALYASPRAMLCVPCTKIPHTCIDCALYTLEHTRVQGLKLRAISNSDIFLKEL
jgi:hypothetical protein